LALPGHDLPKKGVARLIRNDIAQSSEIERCSRWMHFPKDRVFGSFTKNPKYFSQKDLPQKPLCLHGKGFTPTERDIKRRYLAKFWP
jgi:hypothetical protein